MAQHNVPPYRQNQTWVPTFTAVANAADITLIAARYVTIGDSVICFAKLTLDIAAPGATTFRISLPIGLPVAATEDIIGIGIHQSEKNAISIIGGAANDDAVCLSTFASSKADEPTQLVFSYRLQA